MNVIDHKRNIFFRENEIINIGYDSCLLQRKQSYCVLQDQLIITVYVKKTINAQKTDCAVKVDMFEKDL